MPKEPSPRENAAETEIKDAIAAALPPSPESETAEDAPAAQPVYAFPPELMGAEDEPEEPTPLPDASFLSKRPGAGSFFWAFAYAAVSAVFSILASNEDFARKLLISSADLATWKSSYALLTSMLVHSGLDHYLGNMILLVPIAGFTTAYYGFWVFPVMGIILGVATHAISLWTYPSYMHLVGSSGLLYAMFGLWIVLYAGVESHLPLRRRGLRLAGFALLMLLPHTYSPTTSYRAHAIGFALGAMAGGITFFLRRQEFITRNEAARQELASLQKRIPRRRFGWR